MSHPDGAARWMRWLAIAMLLATYPAQAWLPSMAAWENHWVENTQVVVLGGGLLLALVWCHASADARVRALCRAAAVLWAILMARELSWGGAFLPPVGFSSEGPFYSSRALWYKPYVYPVLALLLAYSGYCIVRWRLDRIVLRCVPAVGFEALLIAAGIALSTCAEGHGPDFLTAWMGSNPLVVEEWAELAAYAALVAAQWRVLVRWHVLSRAAAAPGTPRTHPTRSPS